VYNGCHSRLLPGDKTLLFYDFDDSYLERLREGDFRTQEHFVSYFSELIQLKLRSRLRSQQAIEDVRQETFARVFVSLRSAGGIREPERLGAFVNSICNNVLLEHYRSANRQSSLEDEDSQEFPDRAPDALSVLVTKQAQEHVRQVVNDLPERDRRLLKEVLLEERDKDEVCHDFGVDRNYLRVLLHRAKLSFRSLYLKRIEASTSARGK
jgi:RNA polymerase sigma-70 factor, ECF subfamily